MTTENKKVLVVDDEPDIRQLIGQILEDFEYKVTEVHDADAARRAVRLDNFNAIILDIWMPGDDGITLLKEWHSAQLQTPVIMLSAHGSVESAVTATKFGAYDYLEKPVSAGRLEITVRNAVNQSMEFTDNHLPTESRYSKSVIIGSSTKVSALRSQIQNAASSKANVIVVGEPGSGRETVAKVIHQTDAKDDQPLIIVNSLVVEKETQSVLELVESAEERTLLFLDIQNYNSFHQRLLLDIIHQTNQNEAQLRIIATATSEITELLKTGEFRLELYLRISELTLQVPTLRDRAEDIPELVGYYTDYLSRTEGLKYRSFSAAALHQIRNHIWHGNIREFINVLRQIMSSDCPDMIAGSDIQHFLSTYAIVDRVEKPKPNNSTADFELTHKLAAKEFERKYLLYHLQNSHSFTEIAKKSGLHRSNLFRKIRDHGIQMKPLGSISSNSKNNNK